MNKPPHPWPPEPEPMKRVRLMYERQGRPRAHIHRMSQVWGLLYRMSYGMRL